MQNCKHEKLAKSYHRSSWDCPDCGFYQTWLEIEQQFKYNHIKAWLDLIGTVENAKKLRARLDGLKPPELDKNFGPEPPQCPTTVLYGAAKSKKLYADPRYRQALDMWDTGEISARDLRVWCLMIEKFTSSYGV